MPVTIHPNDGKYVISIGGKDKKYTFSSTNNGDAEASKLSKLGKNKGKLVILKKLRDKGSPEVVAKWRDGKRA